MLTRGLLIEKLIVVGVIKKSGRLSPKYNEILAYNPDHVQWLLEYTKHLRYNACMKTRLHCLLQGINYQPYCVCGAPLRMRITGRFAYTFPTHCSNKCTAADPSVTEKRRNTNLTRYGVSTPLLKPDVCCVGDFIVCNAHIIEC